MFKKLQAWGKSKSIHFCHTNLVTTFVIIAFVASLCILATACSSSPDPETINVSVEKSRIDTQNRYSQVFRVEDPVLSTWDETVKRWNTPGTEEYELAECIKELDNLRTDPTAKCPHLYRYHRYPPQ